MLREVDEASQRTIEDGLRRPALRELVSCLHGSVRDARPIEPCQAFFFDFDLSQCASPQLTCSGSVSHDSSSCDAVQAAGPRFQSFDLRTSFFFLCPCSLGVLLWYCACCWARAQGLGFDQSFFFGTRPLQQKKVLNTSGCLRAIPKLWLCTRCTHSAALSFACFVSSRSLRLICSSGNLSLNLYVLRLRT